MPHPPMPPRGSFLGGLCQGCLCHPAAPWSRLAGSPRSPGSRLPGSALGPFVTLHCPLPAPLGGLAGAAGGATASLSPPPVILPSNGVQAPAPPPAPAPTRHAPCDPVPSSRSRMAGRAPRPRPPRSPERQPPSTARSPRSPRTPTPPARPPLRRAVRGGWGGRGGQATPPPLFPGMRPPPMPTPASRSDFPRLPHDTRTAHTLFAGIRHLILKFPYPPSAASSPADP